MKNFINVQGFIGITSAWLLAVNMCTAAPAQPEADNDYGQIQLISTDGVSQCALPVPGVDKTYILDDEPGCKDFAAKSFLLTGVPSATQVRFYSSPACDPTEPDEGDEGDGGFYVNFNTVKNNLTWDPTQAMEIDVLVKKGLGLVTNGYYIRILKTWTTVEGSANGKLKCVVIERSQPAKKS